MDRVEFAYAVKGFMPRDEGAALFEAAMSAPPGALMEIGSYCGRSTVLLGEAAGRRKERAFTIDHHLGSEEHQPGEGYHDPDLLDPDTGRPNTLPALLITIDQASLSETVTILCGYSATFAALWTHELAFLFIDGGHGRPSAHADLDGWTPHLTSGGILAIHDVFPDPRDGGRPPFEIYSKAKASGAFTDISGIGSLRVLRKS